MKKLIIIVTNFECLEYTKDENGVKKITPNGLSFVQKEIIFMEENCKLRNIGKVKFFHHKMRTIESLRSIIEGYNECFFIFTENVKEKKREEIVNFALQSNNRNCYFLSEIEELMSFV